MNKKQIQQELTELMVLKSLTQSYAEIASSRMMKTRDSVLRNRNFLEAINDIFKEVRNSYKEEVVKLARKRNLKSGEKITFLSHNGKTVAVLLSSNSGLYGEIVQKTFDLFLRAVQEEDVEATIVGRLGLSLFQEAAPNRPYTFFDFPDSGVNKEDLAALMKHVVQYEEIRVYYGKFQTVISQVPTMYNISAEVSLYNEEEETKKTPYLFEPSLEAILMFFEEEIFGSIFEQSLRESELAKHASRMLAMDQAGERITKRYKRAKIIALKISHQTENKKQLNALTSILNR
jgi:ATP synthase F1 gamma subunit